MKYTNITLTVAAAGLLALGHAPSALAAGQDATTPAASQSPSSASSSPNGTISASDKTFMSKAAQGSLAEVKLGQLAQDRGSSQSVKDFGRRMVDDHTKALDALKQVAEKKGVTLPSDMDSKDQAEHERLSKLSGAEFDRAYLNYMRKDHKKDVAEFRRESSRAQDPDVKAFASQSLPTLEEHLRLAEKDSGQMRTDQVRTDNTDMNTPGSIDNPTNNRTPNPNYPPDRRTR